MSRAIVMPIDSIDVLDEWTISKYHSLRTRQHTSPLLKRLPQLARARVNGESGNVFVQIHKKARSKHVFNGVRRTYRSDRSLHGAHFGKKFGKVSQFENVIIDDSPSAQPLLETWSGAERMSLFLRLFADLKSACPG